VTEKDRRATAAEVADVLAEIDRMRGGGTDAQTLIVVARGLIERLEGAGLAIVRKRRSADR